MTPESHQIHNHAVRYMRGGRIPTARQIKAQFGCSSSRTSIIRRRIISESSRMICDMLSWPSDAPPVPEWRR